MNLKHLLTDYSNICLSGGADGSDTEWGIVANKFGHKVLHWSFEGHRSKAPTNQLICLSETELRIADPYLAQANKSLRRNWPSVNPVVNSLLRRNYYQISETDSLYAISHFDKDGKVSGGTAWAIQMYIDRFTNGEPIENCKLFLYETKLQKWFTWLNRWVMLDSKPKTPTGIWTGIGSRELSLEAKIAIHSLFDHYEIKIADVILRHPIIDDPKVNDIVYLPDMKLKERNIFGGYGTISRVQQLGDKIYFSIRELGNMDEFDWNEYRHIQKDLLEKYKFQKTYQK